MTTILVGYPGSKQVRNISAYLFEKYTHGLEPIWLEYNGEIGNWSAFVADYLKILDDKEVIFALDDYLISGPMGHLPQLRDHMCTKLCNASLEENREYPVTTQYTLWNREYLIHLLERTTTPWSFEVDGSKIFKDEGKLNGYCPILPYYTNSALSSRWEGIKLDGLSEEDINYIRTL